MCGRARVGVGCARLRAWAPACVNSVGTCTCVCVCVYVCVCVCGDFDPSILFNRVTIMSCIIARKARVQHVRNTDSVNSTNSTDSHYAAKLDRPKRWRQKERDCTSMDRFIKRWQ